MSDKSTSRRGTSCGDSGMSGKIMSVEKPCRIGSPKGVQKMMKNDDFFEGR